MLLVLCLAITRSNIQACMQTTAYAQSYVMHLSTVDYAMTYNNTGSGDPIASLDRILGACEHGVFVCIHSNIGMVYSFLLF